MSSKNILSGKILVIISIIIQLYIYLYYFFKINVSILKIIYLCSFPFFFTITSFFCFYTINLLYAIIAPSRWINQNSKYLTWHKPIIKSYYAETNKLFDRNIENPNIENPYIINPDPDPDILIG